MLAISNWNTGVLFCSRMVDCGRGSSLCSIRTIRPLIVFNKKASHAAECDPHSLCHSAGDAFLVFCVEQSKGLDLKSWDSTAKREQYDELIENRKGLHYEMTSGKAFVWFLTGHGPFRFYQNRFGLSQETGCRLCGGRQIESSLVTHQNTSLEPCLRKQADSMLTLPLLIFVRHLIYYY